jgi:hypothetical protein
VAMAETNKPSSVGIAPLNRVIVLALLQAALWQPGAL